MGEEEDVGVSDGPEGELTALGRRVIPLKEEEDVGLSEGWV